MKTESNWTVVFAGKGKVVLEERPMPELKPGQLLVQTICSHISTGTELTILSGDYPRDSIWEQYSQYPFDAGYSNIGRVIGTGDGVSDEWIGRHVASYATHAVYNTISLDDVRVVPDGVDLEDATMFTIAEIVMNGIRRGHVNWGESVVVFGLGILGQLAVRLCSYSGAMPVFGVDTAEKRLRFLPEISRVIRVNPKQQDVSKIVKENTKGRMADVAFELTGDPKVISSEPSVLHKQGRLVILSSPRGPSMFDFHDLCNAMSLQIIGAHNLSHPPHPTFDNPWTKQRHGELFFDLLINHDLVVEDLITHRVSFREAPAIYGALLQDRSNFMGVILRWQDDK